MADIAPQPFINYGLSQAQQGQATASAGLMGQQAALANQQAQQAAMATELQRRAMPMYRQNLDEMMADMSGTAANSNAPGGYPTGQTPGVPTVGSADASGSPTATPPNRPTYADPGAISEHVRQQSWVEPVTQDEQRQLMQGVIASMMPGGNPAFLEQAKMRQSLRVQSQTNAVQYRAGNTYDLMTSVADPNNKNPLGTLGAIPEQRPVADRISADYKNDPAGAQNAARRYAEVTAFHTHQYTGNKQDMQNGMLVDTTKGAPVTGQQQVLTGLTPEQRDKAAQYYYQPIDVTYTGGSKKPMPRYAAPVDQGGLGGITLGQYLAREDALSRGKNPDQVGATTWNAPDASGNTPAGQQAAAAGRPTAMTHAPTPATGSVPPLPGEKPAVGARLRQVQAQPPAQAPANPGGANPGGAVPAYGTPSYNQYEANALRDPSFRSPYATNVFRNVPGPETPGAAGGIKQYQDESQKLRDYGGEMSKVAGTSLMNLQAAKTIFDHASDTGTTWVTGETGKALSWLAAQGFNTNTAQGRQEGAKYLINFALSSLKDTYGSRPAAFDVKINTEQAFPNLDKMGLPAVRSLVDSQITQATYLKQTAERAQKYSNGGFAQPGSFSTWNEKYFPKETILGGAGAGGVDKSKWETYSYKGDNYRIAPGADRSKKESWEKY